jgi:multicomponent Na+:H+ antiporter subunit D
MINPVHPSLIFVGASLALPLIRARLLKQGLLLAAPLVALADLLFLPPGQYWTCRFMTYDLVPVRVDSLSICFAYVFVVMAFLGMVYALHVKEDGQHAAALLYVGGTLGVTLAGDFFSLFVFWELMALSSVFLIWYRKSRQALAAGFRYLMIHLCGGALLLAGIVTEVAGTGSLSFGPLQAGTMGQTLMLLGFLINGAVPPFHAWLSDAYPEATVTGSVILSAFTTKNAVYVMLRAFPGSELLIWLGVVMALYGIVYAMIENDIRRLLSYHIISQVGYMLCGVGMGTGLAMNGAAAHAFCNIFCKSLLFMATGAVLHVTGKSRMTDLQGRSLYRSMPYSLFFYFIGSFSISAVPLFNCFISKRMITLAVAEAHLPAAYLLLNLASIGTFLSISMKLPLGTWFGSASRPDTREALPAHEPPANMLVAMALTGFICVLIGVYPRSLLVMLPYRMEFEPYTFYSVINWMQGLLAAGLGFYLIRPLAKADAKINLDLDWFYRKGAIQFMKGCLYLAGRRNAMQVAAGKVVAAAQRAARNPLAVLMSRAYGSGGRVENYDPDEGRQAIGLGVLYFLFIFSLLLTIFLISAG